MNDCAIRVSGLHKTYGKVTAVDHLSFQVNRGEIFGLLGPNGAGKTTTIRMLIDIIKPDAGDVRVLNQSPAEVRARVGYLPEERGLYRGLRVGETLTYLGRLKGMTKSSAQKRAQELLDRVELGEWRKHKVQELSRGMQQKVQLIASIIHDPELVILDEPFQGLDPVNVGMVKDLIRDLRAQGKTIVLSAHEMSQVEVLCERIALIDHGRAVLYGALDELKKQFSPNALEISPQVDLTGWSQVLRVVPCDHRQMVYLKPGVTPHDFLKSILDAGLPIEQFQVATMSLEQIFVAVVKGDGNGRT
ncbi:MAG: ABC transporter ATP-binding protein [Chloroflexi bacterium]|nr:ABC transporter ATP-binding protein [Chloroflexota bacterium]